MPSGFDVEAHKRSAKKFSNAVPTRETCDLSNPLEMFVWMLVALPGMNGGQQAMPSAYNMLISQALFQRGAMLTCEACGHAKEPQEVYVPPSAQDPHWMTSPGKWVPKDREPEPERDQLDTVLDAMPNQQQAALFERLKRRHEEGNL